MKRLIALVVILLLAFYVAWPGWNGYQISSAIKARDNATLERKIAFPEVRESLRPAAEAKIGEVYDSLKGQAGAAGAIVGQMKADVVPKIASTALTRLVTAPNLVRVVNDGRSLKESAERILTEEVGRIGLPGLGGGAGSSVQLPGGIQLPGGLGQIAAKIGIPGLGGAVPKGAAPSSAQSVPADQQGEAPRFGISNIKRFRVLGPLAFEIGVAKDAGASEADVVVEMRFVGGDWRVVGVRPRV